MAILHIVNKSPFEKSTFGSCLDHVLKGSSVLLFEDAVVGAVKGTSVSANLEGAMSDVSVYVLGPDLAARGISEDRLIDGIKTVDYKGFVDLSVDNDKVVSWL